MSMKTLYDLKDMLCAELDEIGKKGEMSAGDLETVHKLTDTIKNIDKITMLEEGGYSRDDGRDSLIERMEDIMRGADSKDRETIQRCIDMMRNS